MGEELLRRRAFVEPEKIARRYQLEVLEKALSCNTIIYLETGCGKTLIAILLIRALSNLFRKPNKGICVFLVPSMCICKQQAEYIESHTDLFVGQYCGTGLPTFSNQKWMEEFQKNEVFVMTPMILLTNLRHGFIKKEAIKLLIFDECHHAGKNHPYATIMKEFYLDNVGESPRIFGMTASPINGRGSSACGTQVYRRAIEELESILNAKIFTVKQKADVDMFTPSPNLHIRYYEKLPTTITLIEKLQLLTNEYVRRQLTFASFVGKDSEPIVVMAKERVRLIYSLCSSLEYCLMDLGLWCATKAVQLFLKDESKELQIGLGGRDSTNDCKLEFLHDAFKVLNCYSMEDGIDIGAMQDGERCGDCLLVSTKVQTLLDVLQSYRNAVGLKCIVFVERVLTTRLLTLLLGEMASFAFLKCKSLSGHRSSFGGSSQAHQQQVIKEFRSNQVNLLVATNVAEEGLDIQTCFLVIRFDIPKTERSFIQSKGRARRPGSNYVVLIEAGNFGQESWLESVVIGERLLQKQALESSECCTIQDFPQSYESEAYSVVSTGATVNLDSSVALLHHYCAKLLGHSRQRPEFSYDVDDEGVICTVKLPGREPICKFIGRRYENSKLAKQAACLEACRRLHYSGALSDYLLPVSTMEVDRMHLTLGRSNPQGNMHAMETFERLSPDALRGNWDTSSGRILLHAYSLSFTSVPAGQEFGSFYLILEVELDSAAATMTSELNLPHGHSVVACLQPSGRVELDEHEVKLGKIFQEKLLSLVLDWKTGSSVLDALPTDSANAWDCSRMYLLLPRLHKQGVRNPLDVIIDWDMIRSLSSLIFPSTNSNVLTAESHTGDGSILQFANSSLPAKLAIDAIVFTIHNGWPYHVREVMDGETAESNFKSNPSVYKSYADYFSKRHNLFLSRPKQPLLKAQPIGGFQNFLIERPSGRKSKLDTTVELPPEICTLKLVGLSAAIINAAALLPSFMHRFENFLVAIQLRNKFVAGFKEGGQISSATVLEALTTSKCIEKFSLESLEVLGDSCLKFAVTQHLFLVHADEDEGNLSFRRNSEISNLNLYKLGLAKNIPVHIRDGLFNPEEWLAPGHSCKSKYESYNSEDGQECSELIMRCTKKHHQIKKKTVADVVEALIGGFVVDSGLKAAICFMQWLGLQVHCETYNYFEQPSLNKKIDLAEVENMIRYSFQRKDLLVKAFTHSSYLDSKSNYQRLEFLGDAILDFLIAFHLYLSFPGLKPGLLSDLKSATVNNWSFSLVAMRYNLHHFLLESNTQLITCIKRFISESSQLSHKWEDDVVDDGAPKVLSDLVESLAGAVFIDAGFDLLMVWVVFEPLLQPIVSPHTLQIHPVRELQELCQFHGFELSYTCENLNSEKKRFTAKVEMKGSDNLLAEVAMDSPSNIRKKVDKLHVAKDVLQKLKIKGWLHPCHKLASALKQTSPLEDGTRFKQELFNSGLLIDNNLSKLQFPVKADFGKRLEYHIQISSSPHSGSCNEESCSSMQQFSKGRVCDTQVKNQPSDVSGSLPPNTAKCMPEGNVSFKKEFLMGASFENSAFPLCEESRLKAVCSSVQGSSMNCISMRDSQINNQSAYVRYGSVPGFDSKEKYDAQKDDMASITDLLRLKAALSTTVSSRSKSDNINPEGLLLNCSEFLMGASSESSAFPLCEESRLKAVSSSVQGSSMNCMPESQINNQSAYVRYGSVPGFDSKTKYDAQKDDIASITELLRLKAALSTTVSSRSKADNINPEEPERSKLYQFCAKRNWMDPLFVCCKEEGPSHHKFSTYNVTITLPDKKCMKFSGEPKRGHKDAKDSAASCALIWLKANSASFLQ